MVTNYDPTSPSTQFSYNINKNTYFKKDNQNFINLLGINQLNTLENVSLLDIYLSANNIVEPHYHQNAAELVYCISGAANVSLLNPYTKKIQSYSIKPGQVANIPQGWWHYEEATADDTHLLAIFDAPNPEVILGSELIKLTPPNIMAKSYCMDEKEWKKTIAPVTPGTFIGPPKNCNTRTQTQTDQTSDPQMNHYRQPQRMHYMHPYHMQSPYYYY